MIIMILVNTLIVIYVNLQSIIQHYCYMCVTHEIVSPRTWNHFQNQAKLNNINYHRQKACTLSMYDFSASVLSWFSISASSVWLGKGRGPISNV